MYDAGGGSAGRYTTIFTGLLDLKRPGEYLYLSIGDGPEGEDGSLCRGRLPYERMGREIRFIDLPEECRTLVLDSYRGLWGL